MADAAARTIHKTAPNSGRWSYIMADGITLFEGQLVQLQSGYLNHWDQSGSFLGILLGGDDRLKDGVLIGETGDSPPPEARVDQSGVVLMHLASVGGTPTQAKLGHHVFSADSDTASMTMTDTNNPPVGRLVRFRSATDVDVQLWTPGEFDAGIADNAWNV